MTSSVEVGPFLSRRSRGACSARWRCSSLSSYSKSDSALYLWNTSTDAIDRVLSGPSGFEDLTLSPEGLIWTASESGGRYFPKRFDENILWAQWGDSTPSVADQTFIP